MLKRRVNPSHSMIFISDPEFRYIPDQPKGRLVASSADCVVVPTLPDVDGDTEVELGWDDELTPFGGIAFQGTLELATGTVLIHSLPDNAVDRFNEIMRMAIGQKTARILVRTNDPRMPDKIQVAIARPSAD